MNVKKNVVKNVAKDEKVFTKKLKKDIINKKYNPLKERDGLFMKESEDVVLKEIIKGLDLKERIIVKIFPKTVIKVYRKGMVDCFNYYNKDGTF